MSTPREAALRGGILGNFVDQIHIFLPLVALAPALAHLAGPGTSAGAATIVIIAMMLGRPVGGVVFGRISDRWGRTRTTSLAITGTALCTLAIAVVPDYRVLGAGTMWAILALRFLGGVFIAGEYSAAIPLAMEWSSPRRRGLISGLIMAMSPLAQGGIALLTWVLLDRLDPGGYAGWGWRLGFVAGSLASLGMLTFYRSQVRDRTTPDTTQRVAMRTLFAGAHARSFWQLFGLMTGLWFMTNIAVIDLPAVLKTTVGLSSRQLTAVVVVASLVQAVAMAAAGHLATIVGRRRFFIGWGSAATVIAPLIWIALLGSRGLGVAMLLAATLQAVTVAAYGPVGAYLAEGFPAAIRSTGYGTAYSLSIVIPALHPFYLPQLQHAVGQRTAVVALLVLGGVLVAVCGWVGPRLGTREGAVPLEELHSPPLAAASV